MINFPSKPWAGKTFTHTTSDGIQLVGSYDEDKNCWKFTPPPTTVEQAILDALQNSTNADEFYTYLKNELS